MFEQAFKNIGDVLWKEAGCSSELDYTEQTSWLLFLKYLDGLEQDKSDEAALEVDPRVVRVTVADAACVGGFRLIRTLAASAMGYHAPAFVISGFPVLPTLVSVCA